MLDSLVAIGFATISLGTIHEGDGIKEQDFWLRNAGQEAVTLCQGYTSCGCTTIQFSKDEAIEPGDSTRVTLRFNPQGKGGEFEETGTIVYSRSSPRTSKKHISVSLVGTCITSEETLLRQFPIRISEHLRLSANRFDLGIMHVGETKERGVIILHRDEGDRQERIPVSFTVDSQTLKGLQHLVRAITTVENGRKRQISITLDVLIK